METEKESATLGKRNEAEETTLIDTSTTSKPKRPRSTERTCVHEIGVPLGFVSTKDSPQNGTPSQTLPTPVPWPKPIPSLSTPSNRSQSRVWNATSLSSSPPTPPPARQNSLLLDSLSAFSFAAALLFSLNLTLNPRIPSLILSLRPKSRPNLTLPLFLHSRLTRPTGLRFSVVAYPNGDVYEGEFRSGKCFGSVNVGS